MANGTVVIIVVIYLGIMLFIGYMSSKRISNNEDFMVAGRRLGPLLMAGTLAATEIGGGSSLGVVEKAYGDWGLSASWYVLTMGITFAILTVLGPKFRSALVKTVPEYFRRRYGEAPGFITAIVMLLPLIGLTAVQIIASATVLSVMTGFGYTLSVVIVAVVVTAYSIMGGLWSVTITDFVQMILIVCGMVLAIPYAIGNAGGWAKIVSTIPPEKLSFTAGISFKTIISLVIMYTASFTVGQEAVSRYYAAKDDRSAKLGSIYAGLLNFVYAFIPAILGIVAFSMVKQGLMSDAQIMEHGARYALPTLAITTMPPVIVGLLFAGIISATMSSADSDLLGAGSIFANDIYRPYLNKTADDKNVLRVTQFTMLIVAVFSTIIALTNQGSIIKILMFSFTLRAGGSFLPYLFGHYWKKASTIGTLASLIFGSLAVVLVERKMISFFDLDPIFLGLLVSAITFFGLSFIMPNKRDTTELLADK